MEPWLRRILVCPYDKNELNLKTYEGEEFSNVNTGMFTCPKCKRKYPIGRISLGVPEFLPDEKRDKTAESLWEKTHDG